MITPRLLLFRQPEHYGNRKPVSHRLAIEPCRIEPWQRLDDP